MMYRKPAKFLSCSDGKVWKNSGNHSRWISCYLYDLGDSISFCCSCGISFPEAKICTLMDDILLCWFGDIISPFLFRKIICPITYIFMLQESKKESELYILPIKPSHKEARQKIRVAKAKEKIERKEGFRKKTEKKLKEKEQRKIAHKKANAQKKYEVKTAKKKHQPQK